MKRSFKMILSILFVCLLLSSTVYAVVPLGRAAETDGHISGKTGDGFVSFCVKAYTENWGYVYGASGELITRELVDKLAGWYPDNFNATNSDGTTYYELCISKIGRRGVDCSGLLRAYLWWIGDYENPKPNWSFGVLTANAMFQEATHKGAIGSLPDVPGVILYKPGHVGVYVGGGNAIDARGTQNDMKFERVKAYGWTHWFYSPYLDYSGLDTDQNQYVPFDGSAVQPDVIEETSPFPENYDEYAQSLNPASTLRLGAKGHDVAVMQNRLSELGYFFGSPDGQFGYGTEDALLRFQQDADLPTTGSGDIDTLDLLYSSSALIVSEENSISLFLGKIDENVTKVQNRLKELGYYDNSISDTFDEKTEQAVLDFQHDANLVENGKCTNSVIDALFAEDAPVHENTVDLMTLPTAFDDHNFSNPIQTGTEGYPVALIQEKLSELSYYGGSVDGVYTKETEESVQQFQNDSDLSPSGVATKETLVALFSENQKTTATVTEEAEDTPSPEAVTVNGAITPGELIQMGNEDVKFPVSIIIMLSIVFVTFICVALFFFWRTKARIK